MLRGCWQPKDASLTASSLEDDTDREIDINVSHGRDTNKTSLLTVAQGGTLPRHMRRLAGQPELDESSGLFSVGSLDASSL